MQSRIPKNDRLKWCEFYVETLESNAHYFLQQQAHVYDFDLADAKNSFSGFCEFLGVECSSESLAEWDVRHNRNKTVVQRLNPSAPLRKACRAVANLPSYLADV